MLIVNRYKEEEIWIGEEGVTLTGHIVIKVVGLGSKMVRIGIEAAPNIAINRAEVALAKLNSAHPLPGSLASLPIALKAAIGDQENLRAIIRDRDQMITELRNQVLLLSPRVMRSVASHGS